MQIGCRRRSNTLDNLKWYNLLGDPSLLIRTDVPLAYNMKHEIRQTIRGVEITVTAEDMAGEGVLGLMASVKGSTGQPLATGTTNAMGVAELVIPGVGQLEPNTLLTTTGYNAETRQLVIQ